MVTRVPILYSFRRCPYAMRARMALKQCNIVVELREILLRDKPQDMLNHSPKGTVPVLILPAGEVIDESWDIVKWAFRKSSLVGLQAGTTDQMIDQAERLVVESDSMFKPWLDKYKYSDKYPEHDGKYYRDRCEEFVAELNDQLQRHDYLLNDQLTIADIAISPFIRQFANVDKNWFCTTRYSHLQKWLDGILTSELFTSTMQKHEPWQSGSGKTVFL